jgi:hypothetical protein
VTRTDTHTHSYRFEETAIMTVKVIAQPKKTTRPDGQTPVYPWLVDVPTDGGKD